MDEVTFRPIGIVRTPYTDVEGVPIQPRREDGARGTVEVLPEFEGGLRDLDGFSHVILVYHFHRSGRYRLRTRTFLDDTPRGVFATRSPSRPNGIGISVVRLLGVDGRRLEIEGMDILDGTPLLDIKPYIPRTDAVQAERIGWLEGIDEGFRTKVADGRFKERRNGPGCG
ncbi:MAG: tRNA (N6-threonylcarbamoyladenosine(37)-N6)-methyltransferase TrmO [Thermoplasmata archaeon]|nr:tRNA (N6-threonylcarbamoyladenosine(37)-N6)-methyltransferase TrmO [Thermoplasmata archaeon]